MAPDFIEPIDCLPIVPEPLLKKHHCHQPLDTRFRSAARLLQALWREDRGLPIGSYTSEDGKRHKLGSRMAESAARVGSNFLSAEIAYTVHRQLAYRELGALIDESRLTTNLLSSMPLAFNLFVPVKLELIRATSALHELIPGFAGDVTHVLFEHSPGRGSPQFLGDYSAFDVFLRYRTPEGRTGFVAIEVKYSESMREPIPKMRERYDAVSERSELFRDPFDPVLRANPLQSLWREHLLAQTMLDAKLYEEGWFVFVGPEHNHHVQQAATAFQALLEPPEAHKVRFLNLTLEQVIEAIRLSDPEHAAALHRRYCDWVLVDGEIELNLPKFGSFIPKAKRAAHSKLADDASFVASTSPHAAASISMDAPMRPKKPRRARSQETA